MQCRIVQVAKNRVVAETLTLSFSYDNLSSTSGALVAPLSHSHHERVFHILKCKLTINLKMFGDLSINIVVSVRGLLTETSMSNDKKTSNGLSLSLLSR